MKVRLVGGRIRNIRRRDVLQQPLRGGINGQPGVLQDIARDGLSIVGIDQLYSRNSRKIAASLRGTRHEGKSVKGRIATRSVVIRKEECLAAALVDSGDIQRPAQRCPETLSHVARLFSRTVG